MRIRYNHFNAPFFIFIKGIQYLSDHEVLSLLGFEEFKLANEDDAEREPFLIHLTRDDEWVHIMDNWDYTLWFSKPFRQTLDKLSKQYELFYCSLGDSDESFDFVYYKNGQLIRKYIVEDPRFNGGEVVENFGTPLPLEHEYLKIKDLQTKTVSMAMSVGVQVMHHQMDIRCYDIISPVLYQDDVEFTDDF